MTNAGQSLEAGIAVYLGLGSNIGDREANLREAIGRIRALGLEISKESSVYETEPVGFRDQPWFLNQVIETMIRAHASESGSVRANPKTTAASQARALLSELLKIEHEMGRERLVANGPRVIDIDLLLFGDAVIGNWNDDEDQPLINPIEIVVPHPRMHLRSFVLEPLCEIAPELVHPVLKKTSREMLASLEHGSRVRLREKTDD